MLIMIIGILVSIVGGSITIFSIGVFILNFGFRGYYNAAVLSLTEVTSETNRLSTPIFLHIGWAIGQIILALLGLFFTDWRVIFVLTGLPLIILTFMAYRTVLESPRFLIVRHEFFEARAVLDKISIINQHPQKAYDLEEEKKYR
jgi:MFS family permease